MANICENTIKFIGRKEDIERVKDFILIDNTFDFNKIIPLNNVEDVNEQYSKWGCKWGAEQLLLTENEIEDKIELYIAYDTPWTPAEPIIERIIIEFSNNDNLLIEGSYYEPGVGFVGEFKYKGGRCINKEHLSYEDFISYWSYLLEKEFESIDYIEDVYSDEDMEEDFEIFKKYYDEGKYRLAAKEFKAVYDKC